MQLCLHHSMLLVHRYELVTVTVCFHVCERHIGTMTVSGQQGTKAMIATCVGPNSHATLGKEIVITDECYVFATHASC